MITDLIREYIKSHGIRYSYVADKAGLPRGTFYDFIYNRVRLYLDTYIAVCDALEVDVSYFIDLEKKLKQEQAQKQEQEQVSEGM